MSNNFHVAKMRDFRAELITIALAFFFSKAKTLFSSDWSCPLQLQSWERAALLMELGWVCLSFILHVSSFICFHWLLGSVNHYVMNNLWWWRWWYISNWVPAYENCSLLIIFQFLAIFWKCIQFLCHDLSSWYCKNNDFFHFIMRMTPPTILVIYKFSIEKGVSLLQ